VSRFKGTRLKTCSVWPYGVGEVKTLRIRFFVCYQHVVTARFTSQHWRYDSRALFDPFENIPCKCRRSHSCAICNALSSNEAQAQIDGEMHRWRRQSAWDSWAGISLAIAPIR
jgi:hypothetical protein